MKSPSSPNKLIKFVIYLAILLASAYATSIIYDIYWPEEHMTEIILSLNDKYESLDDSEYTIINIDLSSEKEIEESGFFCPKEEDLTETN